MPCSTDVDCRLPYLVAARRTHRRRPAYRSEEHRDVGATLRMECQLGADVPKDRLANLEPLIAAIASAELGEKRSPAVAGRLPLVSVDWRYIGDASDCGHHLHPQFSTAGMAVRSLTVVCSSQVFSKRRSAKLAKLSGAVLLAEKKRQPSTAGLDEGGSAAGLPLRHRDARESSLATIRPVGLRRPTTEVGSVRPAFAHPASPQTAG